MTLPATKICNSISMPKNPSPLLIISIAVHMVLCYLSSPQKYYYSLKLKIIYYETNKRINLQSCQHTNPLVRFQAWERLIYWALKSQFFHHSPPGFWHQCQKRKRSVVLQFGRAGQSVFKSFPSFSKIIDFEVLGKILLQNKMLLQLFVPLSPSFLQPATKVSETLCFLISKSW